MVYGYEGQRMTMTGGQIWSGMAVGAIIVFFPILEVSNHITTPALILSSMASMILFIHFLLGAQIQPENTHYVKATGELGKK
jgi:uncharacterized membrane protein